MKTKLLSPHTSRLLIDKLKAVDSILCQVVSVESDLDPKVRSTLVDLSWDIHHAKQNIESISEL